jgi:hypothetical protein
VSVQKFMKERMERKGRRKRDLVDKLQKTEPLL